MKTSPAGIAAIRTFEGCRLTAYRDAVGVLTIGIGHVDANIREGQTINQTQADALLRGDLAEAENAVERMVTVPLSQAQFDSLTSLCFNVGGGALQNSTLVRKLNAGDYAGAAAQFDVWVNAGGKPLEGLRRRRAAERAMFESDMPQTATTATTATTSTTADPTYSTVPPVQPRTQMPLPLIPILGALLPALIDKIPDIAKLFTGDKSKPVAERNVEAALKIFEIAKQVTGAANEQAAVTAIVSDPGMSDQMREAVRREWWAFEQESIKEARTQLVTMTQTGPQWASIGYGVMTATLALIIVCGVGAILFHMLHDADTPPEQRGLILGGLLSSATAVISFVFGSSVGSRRTGEAMNKIAGGKVE